MDPTRPSAAAKTDPRAKACPERQPNGNAKKRRTTGSFVGWAVPTILSPCSESRLQAAQTTTPKRVLTQRHKAYKGEIVSSGLLTS
jgi:hypothetical protein